MGRGGGGGYGVASDVRSAVCPHFLFWSRSQKPIIGDLHTHTSLRGCRCAFLGVMIHDVSLGQNSLFCFIIVKNVWFQRVAKCQLTGNQIQNSRRNTWVIYICKNSQIATLFSIKQNVWFQGRIYMKNVNLIKFKMTDWRLSLTLISVIYMANCGSFTVKQNVIVQGRIYHEKFISRGLGGDYGGRLASC